MKIGLEPEAINNPKQKQILNVILQIILKLIDSFGPDGWPIQEIEELLKVASSTNNKALQTNIQQVFYHFI